MSLHIETHGKGEPLLLIHGWGMHGGVWGGIVPRLTEQFCVYVVDLPGHGRSPASGDGDLESIVHALAAEFSAPLNVCGWSLGGQIALRWAAQCPEQVRSLVLLCSTPCFVEQEDWLFGMAEKTLRQFATELEKNYVSTLRRFLALQVRGSEHERELLSQLRASLFAHGEPDLGSLRSGLEILRCADLRRQLPKITQPTLALAGERDKLTPPEASYYLAQSLPNAQVIEIDGAAHAPFLSHPEIVAQLLGRFIQPQSTLDALT